MPIKLIRLQTPNIKFALGGDWTGSFDYYFTIYQKIDAQIRKINDVLNKIRVSTDIPDAFADFDVGDYVRFTIPGGLFSGNYGLYNQTSCADEIVEISSDYSEIVLQLDPNRYNAIPNPPPGESYIEVDFSISYYGEFSKLFLQADIHGADRQYDIPPIQNAFTYEYICDYPNGFDRCAINNNPLITSIDNNFAPPLNKPTHRGLLLNGSTVFIIEKDWNTFLNDDFFYHGVNLSNITFFITPQSQERTYYHLANAPEVRLKIGSQKTTSQKILWVEDIFPAEAGWFNELPDGSAIPITPAVSFTYQTNSSNRPFLTNNSQSVTINPIANISKLRIVRKPFDKIRIEENRFDVDINNNTETFSLPTYLLDSTDANTEFYVYLLGTYNGEPFSYLVYEGVLATPPPPPSPIDVPFCVYMNLSNPCTLTPSIPESTALAIPQPNYNVANASEFIQKYTTNYPDNSPVLPAEPLYYILSPRDPSNAVKPGRVRQDFYVRGFYATSFESGYDTLLPSRVPMPLNRPCPFAPYLNERNETIAGRDSLLIPLAPLLGENEIAPSIPQDPHIHPTSNSYIKGFGIGEYNGIVFQEWYNFQTFTAYNSGAEIKGFNFQILAGSSIYPGDVIELLIDKSSNQIPDEEHSFILYYIVVFEKQSGQIFYHNWAVRQANVPYIQDYDNAPNAAVIQYLHKNNYEIRIQILAPPPGDYVAVAGVRIYKFPDAIPDSRQLYHHENKLLEFTVYKKVTVSIPTFSASQTCCSNFYYHSREITLASFQNNFIIDGTQIPSQTSINTPDPNTKLHLLNYQASDDACWNWMGVEIQLTTANDTPMLQIDAYVSKKVNDFYFNLAPQLISFDILGKVLNEEIEVESEYLLLSSYDKYLKKLQRNVKIRIRISATNLYLKWLIQEFCLFADYWGITELNSNRKNPFVQTKFLPPKNIRWIETYTGFAAEVELESLQTITANEC